MTLLAAFKILLHRYSHQNNIIVGTPIANRNSPEIEDLIGFCINTLALRTDLSGDPSFIELLGRVRETALAAYSHQDVPFEMLVDELRLERDLNRTPLFQVMFVLQNAPRDALQAPGLSFSLVDVEVETAKFDLTLTIEQPQEELSGSLSYKTDLFDVATIKLMLRHFENLLESIVADPNRRVSEGAERRDCLHSRTGRDA
jgi:non-ribosomal peptide synthetase component F